MIKAQESSRAGSAPTESGKPIWIEPDLDFIRALGDQGRNPFKKCMQCGTCSVSCSLSPEQKPFPRKEIIWAAWGMKDHLIRDLDVWLCHQCNDCSTKCPRGARPGDLLAAVRQEVIRHYAVPRFLGRWASQPKYIPLLLAIPAVLLGLALLVKDDVAAAMGLSGFESQEIVFSYSSFFPHWLLNSFFLFFSFLVVLAVGAGIVRFWRGLKAGGMQGGISPPAKPLGPSIAAALKRAITHKDFPLCTTARSRFVSHFGVFFGFIALFVVSLWAITLECNPLIPEGFVYPFNFWNPLKILANLGGVALIGGCLLMIRDRLRDSENSYSSYFDWAFISLLILVGATGFMTEALHYARLVPHRHFVYFVHLVFAFTLLMYLPYSKFAHIIYRTTAFAYAELTGRNLGTLPVGGAQEPRRVSANEEKDRSAVSVA